ncbi:MAG: glycosyltransferase family 9 protein, partial [Thermodesulfovibrionales bacterium]|nr:glycosyltransferase family 9 protein [Thermodesulfovibrionales bacterium]
MGDIVHALPVLHAIKNVFPNDETHWLVAKGFEGLLQGHPLIDKLIVINKDYWKKINSLGKTIKELKTLSVTLKEQNYDIVIDLQGLLRSGILTALTKAPIRIGFSDAREGSPFFYNKKIEGGKDIHAVHRYLKLAKVITGNEIKDIQFPFPPINPSDKVKMTIDKLKSFNIIIPGARWQSKKWQTEKFAQLVTFLDKSSIILGTKADSRSAQLIHKIAPDKVIDLTGQTDLKEMIYIISNANLVITNDTGPMHIA